MNTRLSSELFSLMPVKVFNMHRKISSVENGDTYWHNAQQQVAVRNYCIY